MLKSKFSINFLKEKKLSNRVFISKATGENPIEIYNQVSTNFSNAKKKKKKGEEKEEAEPNEGRR